MSELIRRGIDIAAAAVAIILLAVPFAVIGILIKLDSHGPVFFRQDRVGKGGETFKIWKFRTMVDGAINLGLGIRIAQDDDRITRIGKPMRILSIDELPQFINVLLGSMTLVGPRPTLQNQVDEYTLFQRQRLLVKPGITSWASVNGRNNLTWEERIDLDVWYVHHRSLWLDLRILFKTLWVVLVTREGVYSRTGVNEELTGSQRAGATHQPE